MSDPTNPKGPPLDPAWDLLRAQLRAYGFGWNFELMNQGHGDMERGRDFVLFYPRRESRPEHVDIFFNEGREKIRIMDPMEAVAWARAHLAPVG